MNKVKRAVLSSVSFVLVFCFLFFFLSYLVRPTDNESRNNIMGYYAEAENTLDMVYVGGSAGYVFWEPLQAWNRYGFTSYNFGICMVTANSLKHSIIELMKTQSPKLLLIDLRAFQYGNRIIPSGNEKQIQNEVAIRSAVDSLKYSKNRLEMINSIVPKSHSEIEYYFDLFKYHSNVRSLSTVNFSNILNVHPSKTKGFVSYVGVCPLSYTDCKDIKTEKVIEDSLNTVFIDLLDYCKTLDAQCLFIVHSYKISAEDQEKYNYMHRIISTYGFDYLNCNDYADEIGYNYDTDFYDKDHVNVFGADKYTAFLSEYLTTHYSFEDKRGNPDYSSWNEDYKQWVSETDGTKEVLRIKIKNKKYNEE